MQLNSILYMAYSITAITISIILALLFWSRRNAAGAGYMSIMMCFAAWWGLSDFISDLSFNHTYKIFWDHASYFGVVAIPVAWLAFVMEYAKYGKYLTRRNICLLSAIPAVTLLLVWTNDLHHLMLAKGTFVEMGQITVLSTAYNSWFLIHAVYSYSLILAGLILLVKNLVSLPQILRSQSVIILVANIVPLLSSILYVFRALPSYPIDPTVFSFTITGILCFIGMFRYKLFELVQAARDAVIESMNGCLAVLDNHNRIIDLNPAAKEMLGGSEEDFVGKRIFDLLKGRSLYLKKFEHVQKAEEKISLEIGGVKRYFDFKITPLLDNRGKAIGKSITFYDITALEEAIEHFKEAHKAAEEANNAKSQFLATMSHEIRTPLNGIIGLTELLSSARLTEEEKEYLQSLRSCAGVLQDIVNDILDFSKIEAGKMELESTGFNLRGLIDETIKTFSHKTKEKDIEFKCNAGRSIPEYVMGDPVRVRQILVNLIGNAFKFTEKGRIDVTVEQLKCDDRHSVVQFSVSDTGIGVPEDKLDNLFERFRQVDNSTTRKYGGTGLGLAIVKNLVTMMGGSIGLESQLGEGSRFSFTIPFEISGNGSLEDKSGSGADDKDRNISVLLIEDNKVNQMLITKLLEKRKIKTAVTGNGKEALKILDKEVFDLILMDIQMPEMDGYETTEAIRKKEAVTGKHVPIIALTANATEKDRSICLEAGMDDYLTKPIRTDKLFECLYKYI